MQTTFKNPQHQESLAAWNKDEITKALLTRTCREMWGNGNGGLTVAEIADRLRIPVATVEGQIFTGGAR